ncbi:phosphotyrosine protein phosphatase [Plectosphaerella plurivora]|uniref:Phosphotyrosine protein phosphatase n=1 Tax=Plectosphaerella plurivora TaxID=936078 RepID=A0A9P8VN80_9PEZI|nr:phosphotyrosine protein phosphatase [Plectosphaerella plurivora]
MPEQKISVLFVCLGNICRSTMAEGVFREFAKQPEYKDRIGKVDSSGTGAYHIGDAPDHRTMLTLESNGIKTYRHKARKVCLADFDEFDYIFAMDRHNLQDLQRLHRGNSEAKAKVQLWGEYSGTGKAEEVEDPYYGGREGFKEAYKQCKRYTENFLAEVFPDVDATS